MFTFYTGRRTYWSNDTFPRDNLTGRGLPHRENLDNGCYVQDENSWPYYVPYKCWISSHYNDVLMSVMASQITSVSLVYLAVCSGSDQRKHQSSASLAFVRGIHRWPVNSPHKGPVTRKMFPFEDVIMLPITLAAGGYPPINLAWYCVSTINLVGIHCKFYCSLSNWLCCLGVVVGF